MALEIDYRSIGVPELVFIDPRKRQVRLLRRRHNEYVEEVVTAGAMVLEALDGLSLELDWLFMEPRPGMRTTVETLLAQSGSAEPAA